MRVLWVKMGGLWPLNTGGRQRSFQLLRELSRRHQVGLVTTDGPDDEPAGLANSLDRCERIVSVPYHAPKQGSARFAATLARSWASRYPVDLWKWRSPEVRRLIAQFIAGGRFDVVVADFLAAIPNVPRQSRTPVVFFAHNVEHMIWRRLHGGIANAPVYQLWLSAVGLQPQDNAFYTATYPWLGFRIGVIGNLRPPQERRKGSM